MKIEQTKIARIKRFREFRGLAGLPFLSKEQGHRYRFLQKQVKVDNRFAFEEDLKKRG